MGAKIATCCYCGARTMLVLDRRRQELGCGSCGAPLRDMKMMPQAMENPRDIKDVATKVQKRKKPKKSRDAERAADNWPTWPGRRKSKKRKPLGRKVLSEIWDVVEDIFD